MNHYKAFAATYATQHAVPGSVKRPAMPSSTKRDIEEEEDERARLASLPPPCAAHAVPGTVNRQTPQTDDDQEPRVWHWGHAWLPHHTEMMKDKKCLIGHHEWQLEKRGQNTHRQFLDFEARARKGDIIFLHCSQKGGLTHWGKYLSEGREDKTGPSGASALCAGDRSSIPGKLWTDTTIRVDEWRELPKPLDGSGRNATLYEVKSTTKNHENYSV